MILYIITLCVLFLAFTNGANDNFKGVATLYGTKELSYTQARLWSTVATFLGVLCSVYFAEQLLKSFSGKGLVSDETVQSELFIAAVCLAAGITVFIATRVGMPVSTTHGLIGALVGSGLMADAENVNLGQLGVAFLLPLVLSPLISGLLSWIMAKILPVDVSWSERVRKPLHIFLGGGVCFARGLNDAPKIAGMLLIVKLQSIEVGMLLIGLAMIIGGWIQSKKVAATMSQKLAQINANQGVVASSITATLVTCASLFGMPVSTTHVAVGSIYGVSVASNNQNNNVFKEIVLSWLLTMPIAGIISYICYFCLTQLIP